MHDHEIYTQYHSKNTQIGKGILLGPTGQSDNVIRNSVLLGGGQGEYLGLIRRGVALRWKILSFAVHANTI